MSIHRRAVVTCFAAVAYLAVVAATPDAAWARKKHQPVPQWALDAAKIPTPDSAKGSPAVLLSDEYLITVDEKNQAVERERWAVRILEPQGRSEGHCSIDYDVDEKLNYFRSWTITPDGQQFQAMEEDFRDVGAYSDAALQYTERTRTVNPPAADPGAVVVCETEQTLRPYMDEEDWSFQYSIPVVKEALELDLPPGGHFAESWANHEPVKPMEVAPNHLRWELSDVPKLDLENIHATPPWRALAGRMSVKWGDMAVNGADNQWRALGLWEEKLEEHRTDPSPEITAKVQELTAGAPDFYTKLSRITQYIQKGVRYFIVVRGIGGWQAHPAAEIFRNSYGDCKDKTTLLISMLQVIGVRAYYLHVDSNRGVIDPTAPSLIGNHMITAIELPDGEKDPRLMALVKAPSGKTLLIFDPTDEVTPVGKIRGALQGAWGNISDGDQSRVLQMPVLPPDSAGRDRTGTFTLAGDGTLTGDVHVQFSGDDATAERWFLKDSDTKDVRESLEKSVASDLPGLAFKGYEFHDATELAQPLNLDLHFSVANYAHATGPLLLLRPRVMGSVTVAVPGVMEGKPRKYPIELGHPGRWHDSYTITLPPGYVLDDAPAAVDIATDFASYKSAVTSKDGQLHYDREYVLRQVEIPAAKADEFRKLEEAILNDERGTAVLKQN